MGCFSVIPSGSLLVGQSTSIVSEIFSAFLFPSIIPVLRAKETLHGGEIQERRMKEYTGRVGKVVQETEESK